MYFLNPLKGKLDPICHFLALLAHHILNISRIRVKCTSKTTVVLIHFISQHARTHVHRTSLQNKTRQVVPPTAQAL